MARNTRKNTAPAKAEAVSTAPANATHVATLAGETVYFEASAFDATVQGLMSRHPGAGVPKIVTVDQHAAGASEQRPLVAAEPAKAEPAKAEPAKAEPAFSDFGSGNQVVDHAAKARIEAQHEQLRAAGVAVDAGQLYFETGTRMARGGYDTQRQRKAEHDASAPMEQVAAELRQVVESERREDVVVTAAEFARSIKVNGKITGPGGRVITERAVRGLLGRLESPALSYVLGLRERIGREVAKGDKKDTSQIRSDREKIADVLYHECVIAADTALKLRVRDGVSAPDIFAVVSPLYAPADAPELIGQIMTKLPADARGSYSYDPTTTTWELRGNVWTPTPVDEQAVGEAFQGYVSFRSVDNGTGKLNGGGGVVMLRCLNASTYVADSADVARRHVGKILVDVEKMIAGSLSAITKLCAVWGAARKDVVEKPVGLPPEYESLVGLPASQAIKGIWWGELGDRRSELAAVLPGRTAEHVERLTAAYFEERRDPERVVRADFAQGWTRYIQDQPAHVRRDAEAAVGKWLVSSRPMSFAADRVDFDATN